MDSTKKHIFIMGAQRSGTTLLRLILNTHSQIAITREAALLLFYPLFEKRNLNCYLPDHSLKEFSDYISSVVKSRPWYDDYSGFFSQLPLKKKTTLYELIGDMFSSYCQKKGKTIGGNKAPGFFRKFDMLLSLFPSAKYIHIVRDGRDAFDSRRKKLPSEGNVAISAIDWNYNLYHFERSFKKIPANNKITIQYEDLLENPENTIKSVCSTLEVEYEATMLDFYKAKHDYISPEHSKLIFTPLNKDNKYKWKKNLSFREVKIFNLLSRHYLKKYNYEIENNKLNLSDSSFLFKSLCVGLPPKLVLLMSKKYIRDFAAKLG